MAKLTLQEKKIIFERRDELTVLEPYGTNCIRCRSTKNSRLSEDNWTLLPPKGEDICVVEEIENGALLKNGSVSVKVDLGTPWCGGLLY